MKLAVVKISVGKATCSICGKKILKGYREIKFIGWNHSECVHESSVDCDFIKREVILK